MIVYIPQNIDPYNTHLKNLVEAYNSKGIEIIVGYDFFLGNILPDIIHFHFLEGILKHIKYNEIEFFNRLDAYKEKGVVFLLTMHDLRPHAKVKQFDYPTLFRKFLHYVNLFIHHGENSIEILKREFPVLSGKARHIVCHHGDYLNDMRIFNQTQEEARIALKLPLKKKIILIFGQLQFKNTSFAEEVFGLLSNKYSDAILLMAGVKPIFRYNRINKIYYKINNTCFNFFRTNKVLIHNRFSQLETYQLFMASDMIFLPHKSGLTSGLIPMAATLGKPFVYPNIGVFEEQAEYCFAQKYESNNKNEAFNAIQDILSSGVQSFDNSKWLENNNWEKHVEHIFSNL
ncbi:MAG: hypothetical protein ACOYNC_13765 [Bacteroidales bacterium]